MVRRSPSEKVNLFVGRYYWSLSQWDRNVGLPPVVASVGSGWATGRPVPTGFELAIMTFQADQVAKAVYGTTASVCSPLIASSAAFALKSAVSRFLVTLTH